MVWFKSFDSFIVKTRRAPKRISTTVFINKNIQESKNDKTMFMKISRDMMSKVKFRWDSKERISKYLLF